ncbi:MAG: hypothetical protein ACI4VF_05100, partial [Lachnospirales bacterium]
MKLFDKVKDKVDNLSVDTLKNRVEAIKENLPKKENKEKEVKTEKPKEDIPEGSIKCPNCQNIIEKKALGALKICPKCAKLFRMNAKDRVKSVADKGSFVEF